MLKVYGVHGSPFVRKVLISLEHKKIAYDLVPTMPFSGDEGFLKINPLGKIPALQDGDLTLCDSKVICRYIESKHPTPALQPSSIEDKAKADWIDELCGGGVAELAAGIFFQRFMRPFAFKQDPDEELVSKITDKKLPPLLDYLETLVPADSFIFGEFMMADLSVASPFYNAGYAGYEVDAKRWPKVAGLIARVREVAEVKAILEKEAEVLGLK